MEGRVDGILKMDAKRVSLDALLFVAGRLTAARPRSAEPFE